MDMTLQKHINATLFVEIHGHGTIEIREHGTDFRNTWKLLILEIHLPCMYLKRMGHSPTSRLARRLLNDP